MKTPSARISSLIEGGECFIPAFLQTVLDSDEVVLEAQQVLLVHLLHRWGTLRNATMFFLAQGTCSRSSLLVSNPQGTGCSHQILANFCWFTVVVAELAVQD